MYNKTIEIWKPFELVLTGPQEGNPFTEVKLFAEFKHNHQSIKVRGFYDGNGIYKVRFMSNKIGNWKFETSCNIDALNKIRGEFICNPATENNHGPVKVFNKTHFSYEDGTVFHPFGTTAYAWMFQTKEKQIQTLQTLSENKFNKLRMCIFPKYYNYNTDEPELYPYQGEFKDVSPIFTDQSWNVKQEDIAFDFSRFNPEYFRRIEEHILELDALGVEADLILFHPYDHWGFARMGKEMDTLYLEYIVARFASFKNVWWSLANEYDLLEILGQKTLGDWDFLCQKVQQEDPSQHLLSIHNFYDPPRHKGTTANWYDQTKPWITHLSIQSDNLYFVPNWLKEYQKPVVIDECRYEGNIEFGWGDMCAEGMSDSFWKIVCHGGYATHGETYIDRINTSRSIWWSHGGELYGESHLRINYLYDLLKEHQIDYLYPIATEGPHWELYGGSTNQYEKVLIYLGDSQPEFEILDFLPEELTFNVTLIDTWNMIQNKLNIKIDNKTFFQLPRKKYQALLLTKEEKGAE